MLLNLSVVPSIFFAIVYKQKALHCGLPASNLKTSSFHQERQSFGLKMTITFEYSKLIGKIKNFFFWIAYL